MKNTMQILALVVVLFLNFSIVRSQNESGLINRLLKEDSSTIVAIALYPESARKNILESCAHPEAIAKMEMLQENTSEKYKLVLQEYPKETQIRVWDLSRYPGLISALVTDGKKSKDELNTLSEQYPVEIRETILESGRKDFELLYQVNKLNEGADQAFAIVMKEYPDALKKNLNELTKYPEAVKTLSAGMRTTVLLGDAYKKNPQAVKRSLDSLSVVFAEENAKNLEDWKKGLQENPEAQKEMEAAAKKFTSDEGYDENRLVITNQTVIVNYVCYPYSYWMGYPYWYEYPYWYPYPYWYDCGFYWTPYGIVYFGLPSPYFTYWFFYHHHHHYYYNHFSDYCIHYHYGHRGSLSGMNREISHWIRTNERTLPPGFFADDAGRPARIKELGKFEIEYNEATKGNGGKEMSREEYLRTNSGNYPTLSAAVRKPGENDKKPVVKEPVRVEDPVYDNRGGQKPNVRIPQKPEPVKPRITPKPRFEQPRVPPRQLPKRK